MRKRSGGRSHRRDERQGNVGVRELEGLYAREVSEVSELLYYSLLFEGEYSQLSALFERCAREALGRARRIGKELVVFGGERDNIGEEEIVHILSALEKREREGAQECERISSHISRGDIKELLCELSIEKREIAENLRRMLES